MIHHLAIAVKDFKTAHEFYTEVMGFRLVKVVKEPVPNTQISGWTRHVFYEVDGINSSLFALWDLGHAEGFGDWRAGFSAGTGLPWWVNHVAFQCADEAALMAHKQHWLDAGQTVTEIRHEFIHSIYTRDPEGNLLEWTYKTRPLGQEDVEEAYRLLADDSEATQGEGYEIVIHKPNKSE